MSRRKMRNSLAGLVAVAALGVMAFASSAQAVGPLDFYVNGVPNPTTLHVELEGSQIGTANALLLPSFNVEIKCGTFSVQEGLLLGPDEITGKLLFEECKVFESGGTLAELSNCHIIASTTDARLHITASGKILPAELSPFNGTNYAVLVEGKSLVLIKQPSTCVLPEHTVIKGEVCLKIDTNHTTPLLLLTNQTIQGECTPRVLEALGDPAGTKVKDKLLFGTNEAFLDLHANVKGKAGTSHAKATLGVLLLP
jgi:hypothetical protein